MSERENESFDIDEEFVVETEDSTDYDGLLARVDKRVRAQGKRGKAAWSQVKTRELPCFGVDAMHLGLALKYRA